MDPETNEEGEEAQYRHHRGNSTEKSTHSKDRHWEAEEVAKVEEEFVFEAVRAQLAPVGPHIECESTIDVPE